MRYWNVRQIIVRQDPLHTRKVDLRMLRGQGYDDAGNMAGRYAGTSALIQEKCPLALYTHCAAYVLNLCAMSIFPVRNMIGTIKDI